MEDNVIFLASLLTRGPSMGLSHLPYSNGIATRCARLPESPSGGMNPSLRWTVREPRGNRIDSVRLARDFDDDFADGFSGRHVARDRTDNAERSGIRRGDFDKRYDLRAAPLLQPVDNTCARIVFVGEVVPFEKTVEHDPRDRLASRNRIQFQATTPTRPGSGLSGIAVKR
ncbi:hypothetical protein [Burkholderia anthina]|uniref:hypothetical protein n=1 Tax=Burkholderia anthina TaxID=179879 RepID=UPI00158A60C4|nr:hypothetical protein [Burkholderia anthina]